MTAEGAVAASVVQGSIVCQPPGRMVYSWRFSAGFLPGPWGEGSCVTKVIIEPDESFESALKRFKKQCEKAGLLSELKRRQHFEKPSVRRRRKTLVARQKAKKRERVSD